jgi:hypothetical protein
VQSYLREHVFTILRFIVFVMMTIQAVIWTWAWTMQGLSTVLAFQPFCIPSHWGSDFVGSAGAATF